MREFKWMCFGMAIGYSVLCVWMFIAVSGPAKYLSLFLFSAAVMFFYGFYVMREGIKRSHFSSNATDKSIQKQIENCERIITEPERREEEKRQWFYRQYLKKDIKPPRPN